MSKIQWLIFSALMAITVINPESASASAYISNNSGSSRINWSALSIEPSTGVSLTWLSQFDRAFVSATLNGQTDSSS